MSLLHISERYFLARGKCSRYALGFLGFDGITPSTSSGRWGRCAAMLDDAGVRRPAMHRNDGVTSKSFTSDSGLLQGQQLQGTPLDTRESREQWLRRPADAWSRRGEGSRRGPGGSLCVHGITGWAGPSPRWTRVTPLAVVLTWQRFPRLMVDANALFLKDGPSIPRR